MLALTVTAMLWGLTGGQLLSDDFDNGPFLSPGPWTSVGMTGPVSSVFELETAAAHRGDGGLTLTLVPDGGPGVYGPALGLNFFPRIDGGTVSARVWVRERQDNNAGALIVTQFYGDNISSGIAAEAGFNHVDGQWHLQGYDDSAAPQSVVLAGVFTRPEWHLMDFELDGIGSDAGTRVLLIDGAVAARVDGLDFSDARITGFDLGADYLYLVLGDTVDFDDVRVDTAPQGETLWPLIAQMNTGDCTPCALPLADWQGTYRASPYTFPMTLSSSAGLSLYANAACTGPTLTQATFSAGSMGAAVWARATAPGLHWVEADYVDFLSRRVNEAVFGDAGAPLTLGVDTVIGEAQAPNDGTQPAVGFDGTQFLAVWGDGRAGDAGIFASRFATDGTQTTMSFPISVDIGARAWPDVAFDGTDFVVAWHDGRANPFADIYAARVTPSGVVRDPAGIPISQDPAGQKFVPQVRCIGPRCLIVWSDRSPSPAWQLKARHVDVNLTVQEPQDVPVMATATSRYLPRLSNGDGGFFLAWGDERIIGANGTAGTRLDASGQSLDGDGGRLSPHTGPAQLRPAVTWDGTSWWVAWTDTSFPLSILELARIRADGVVLPSPAGPVVALNALRDPELAFDGINVWLAFGADTVDSGSIMGMRYGLDGLPVDLPQPLSTPAQWTGLPALGSDGQRRALLVWVQSGDDGGTALHHRLLIEGALPDAGVDAGADAGVDAGTSDAGPLQPRIEQVACGCAASPQALSLAAALWLLRRRYGAERNRGRARHRAVAA